MNWKCFLFGHKWVYSDFSDIVTKKEVYCKTEPKKKLKNVNFGKLLNNKLKNYYLN